MRILRRIADPVIRRALGISILDGIAWSLMFGFAENLITPFATFFNARPQDVSLLTGIATLGTALAQLTGGELVHRWRRRRSIAVTMAIGQACCWPLAFLLTVITHSPLPAFCLYIISLAFVNLAVPAWISWMNDLVPPGERGSYFSGRNQITGFAQFLAMGLGGLALWLTAGKGGELWVYGGLFILAGLMRFGSAAMLAFQYEPPFVTSDSLAAEGPAAEDAVAGNSPSAVPAGKVLLRVFTDLWDFAKSLPSSNFGRFVIFSVLTNFAIVMITPVIQFWILKGLGLGMLWYTVLTVTGSVSIFLFMTYWGPLADRFGNYRILMVTACLLPVLALGWVFLRNPWELLALQVLSGFVIGGLNLCTTNYIFDAVPAWRMSRVMAWFNTLNLLMGALGLLTGGLILALLQAARFDRLALPFLNIYTAVFLLAAVLRFAVLVGFRKSFGEVRATEHAPGLLWFYVRRPAQELAGFVSALNLQVTGRFKGKGRKER